MSQGSSALASTRYPHEEGHRWVPRVTSSQQLSPGKRSSNPLHVTLTSLHSVSLALGSAISMRSSPMRGTQVSMVWLWWWFPTMEFMLELEWFLGKKPSFSSLGWLRRRVVAMRVPISLATWGSQITLEPWQPSATATHLCFSSRARSTLARSSALIWSEIIIVSTMR